MTLVYGIETSSIDLNLNQRLILTVYIQDYNMISSLIHLTIYFLSYIYWINDGFNLLSLNRKSVTLPFSSL